MRCFIKNIPAPTFGIAGNRGVGFPLVSYCSTIPQPIVEDANCYLVKEEDGFTNILTEIENEINVTCTDPEAGVCYIVLQEDRNIWLGQQEDEDLILCSGFVEIIPSECYLVTQEDRDFYIADQENGDYIFVNCEVIFLSKEEDIDIAVYKEDESEILLEYSN